MYIRNLEGEEFLLQATTSHSLELNGDQSIEFTVIPSKVNRLFIKDVTEMWTVTDDDDIEYRIIFCKRKGEGDMMTVEVKAVPLFFDVLDNDRIYDRINGSMTASTAFSRIFEGTGFDFVLVDFFYAVDWEGFGSGESKLETFKRAINRYKAEFRIVGKTVFLESRVGRDTSIMYRHRLNASDIVQEIDAGERWTYAMGYGNYEDTSGDTDNKREAWEDAELIREYTSPLAKIIGIRHAPPVKDGRITKASTMDANLKELVDNSLKISISAGIHDLRKQGYPIGQIELGDRVFVIDERIDLDEEVRIVSYTITKDWRGNVLDLSVTFGSEGVAKRHQSKLTTAAKDIRDVLEGRKQIPMSALDRRVHEISSIINGNSDSVFEYMPNGVLGWNGDNPNYMTRYVGDGIGFSRDGGNTYNTAMSAELGIVADYITTGTLRSILIEGVEIRGSEFFGNTFTGGIIKSQNTNTNFNMNTGELEMERNKIKLGNGADVEFTDAGNRLYYRRNDWAAGIGVGTSINDTYSYAYLGVSKSGRPTASDPADYSGFIANANDRETVDAIGNSVVGNRFHVRDKAVGFSKAFLFRLNVDEPYFSPINTGDYSYGLGAPNNRWSEIYGNLVGTSTHASKMAIEDVDARKAYEYFDMMQVKSYYYKDEDYTDKYKRHVSPIMEQLDPVLENLYKANPDALDISSNFFLFVKAMQYKLDEINERLELLENGI